jgi:hypothetical protein
MQFNACNRRVAPPARDFGQGCRANRIDCDEGCELLWIPTGELYRPIICRSRLVRRVWSLRLHHRAFSQIAVRQNQGALDAGSIHRSQQVFNGMRSGQR